MIKILISIIVSISLTYAYNYGENQVIFNTDQTPTRTSQSFVVNKPWKERLSGGLSQSPSDNQDNSHIIRQPSMRPSIIQRNINYRSAEQLPSMRSANRANILPNAGFTNNDMAANERTNQRLSSLSNESYSPKLNKEVSISSSVSTHKNDPSPSLHVSSALSLSQLNRLRSQSYSGSPYYRHETLEQILNRRSADKFLGHGFIQQQLINQKGENKFLKVHGKEEREMNGTIEIKKGGLMDANLEEIKEGKFSVMDKDNHKVGDVNIYRDVEKHLRMTENNGVTNIELEKNSNAELNVERDVNLSPRINGQLNSSNPSHKVRLHVEQNQNSRANVEISKNEVEKTTTPSDNNYNHENRRYRRDINGQLNKIPLNISGIENNPFVRRIGSVFDNLGTKVNNLMGTGRGKVCAVLMKNSEKFRTKLDQIVNKSPIDLNKDLNASNSDFPDVKTQEEQGKIRSFFNNIQKNTLKIMNNLTNRAILMLKNCSDVSNGEKIYEGPIDSANSQFDKLPSGENIIVTDTKALNSSDLQAVTQTHIASIPHNYD